MWQSVNDEETTEPSFKVKASLVTTSPLMSSVAPALHRPAGPPILRSKPAGSVRIFTAHRGQSAGSSP